jgi:hypothetical protein
MENKIHVLIEPRTALVCACLFLEVRPSPKFDYLLALYFSSNSKICKEKGKKNNCIGQIADWTFPMADQL